MYDFVTIRCRCCGAVIYNLPHNEMNKVKLINFMCEDCTDYHGMQEYVMEFSHRAGKQDNKSSRSVYNAI